MSQIIKDAIRIALELVGIKEVPPNSNRGAMIDLIQKPFKMVGQQYCVMFTIYCYLMSCLKSGIVNFPFLMTASSQSLFEWAKKNGYAETDFSKLDEGDIVIWRKFKLWQGHAGIVEYVDYSNHLFRTIEGNTQDSDFGDQRDGGGIYRRIRYMRKMDFSVDNFYLRGFVDVSRIFKDEAENSTL